MVSIIIQLLKGYRKRNIEDDIMGTKAEWKQQEEQNEQYYITDLCNNIKELLYKTIAITDSIKQLNL